MGLSREEKQKEFFQKALDYATSRQGKCLSTEYLTAKTKMRWKCDNPAHHEWESTYEHVVSRNRWCQQCAYDCAILKDGYKKAQEYAKAHNGLLLTNSDEIIKKHSVLEWKCHDDSHPAWKSQFRNMLDFNTWCPRCAGKLPEDEYLKKAQNLAISKGGKCLSKKYIDKNKMPLKWHCGCENHEPFEAPLRNVERGSWCLKCKNILTPEESLVKAKNYAISKGGECISDNYTLREKMNWKCYTHGIFKGSYLNIVNRNHWCPDCFKEKRDENSLKRAKDYAIKRGGQCLTIKYNGNGEKLEWKCGNPIHASWLAPISIATGGWWCPECGDTYYKEKSTRLILERLLGFELPKARPCWNINPRSKQTLELDGYNEDNKFAFEFQGRHHYMDGIFKRQDLEDIQFKDKIKKEHCEKQGIYLLIVDDNPKIRTDEKLLNMLIKFLEDKSISYKKFNKDELLSDLAKLKSTNEKIEKLKQAQEFAKKMDGECLSQYYKSSEEKLEWKCSNTTHKSWLAIFNTVVNHKKWCSTCKKKKK